MKKLTALTLAGILTIGSCFTALAGAESGVNQPTMITQTIGLKGVENARELGGYETMDGKHVKRGKLLRSGKLASASEEDLTRLREVYELSQIIDFRTSEEVASGPDPAIDGARHTRIGVLDEENGSGSLSAVITGVYGKDPVDSIIEMVHGGMVDEGMYVSIVNDKHAQDAYRQFFDLLLAHENGAILWHCTGGKDRAGTAAVLLLSALGVDRDTILKDFALTNEFNASKINYMAAEAQKRTSDPVIIQGVRTLTGVDASFMANMLDAVDSQYGSMDQFLKTAIRLTEAEQNQLKRIYLE